MANRDTPGFRLAKGKNYTILRFPVDASNSTNVFVGDVVANNAAGSVRPAAADAGVTVAGVVVALYDSNGNPVGSPNSSVSTKYLPLSTAGYADVALALPDAIFIAQGQTGQTPAAADVWATTDHVAGSGNTTLGISGHELNCSDLNTGAQLQILGKVDEPGNDWGANVDLYVRFHESALALVDTAVGV